MKQLPWVLVCLLVLVVAVLVLWNRPTKPSLGIIERDTIFHVDTVRDTVPRPIKTRHVRTDTVYLPIIVDGSDSVVHDSAFAVIPIEQKEYKTELYHAYVSGYHAALDSINVYIPKITIIEKIVPKSKRFGLGLQAGYGYPSGFYVGVGVSYNLWQW